MFQVVIEFPAERDPVRHQHGLAKLLEYANWVEAQTEFPTVRRLTPIVWACEEPVGFGLYEAESEGDLQSFLARLHNTESVRVLPCRYLSEVMQLAELRLVAMRSAHTADAATG
jgi:hypothetical protein